MLFMGVAVPRADALRHEIQTISSPARVPPLRPPRPVMSGAARNGAISGGIERSQGASIGRAHWRGSVRTLRKTFRGQFRGQRESTSLGLAGDSHCDHGSRPAVEQIVVIILKTAVGTAFEVRNQADVTACLCSRLCRISALPSRDRKGAVTKINCSALHLSGDNCFPHNHLTSCELANSRRFNCRFWDNIVANSPNLANQGDDPLPTAC